MLKKVIVLLVSITSMSGCTTVLSPIDDHDKDLSSVVAFASDTDNELLKGYLMDIKLHFKSKQQGLTKQAKALQLRELIAISGNKTFTENDLAKAGSLLGYNNVD